MQVVFDASLVPAASSTQSTMSHRQDTLTSEQQLKDEALLASLGYKQELKRHFSGLELFGLAFSLIG